MRAPAGDPLRKGVGSGDIPGGGTVTGVGPPARRPAHGPDVKCQDPGQTRSLRCSGLTPPHRSRGRHGNSMIVHNPTPREVWDYECCQIVATDIPPVPGRHAQVRRQERHASRHRTSGSSPAAAEAASSRRTPKGCRMAGDAFRLRRMRLARQENPLGSAGNVVSVISTST